MGSWTRYRILIRNILRDQLCILCFKLLCVSNLTVFCNSVTLSQFREQGSLCSHSIMQLGYFVIVQGAGVSMLPRYHATRLLCHSSGSRGLYGPTVSCNTVILSQFREQGSLCSHGIMQHGYFVIVQGAGVSMLPRYHATRLFSGRTHTREFSRTLPHGNSKIEIRQRKRERSLGNKRGMHVERNTVGRKKFVSLTVQSHLISPSYVSHSRQSQEAHQEFAVTLSK